MRDLREDEAPRSEPFWMIDDVADAKVVGKVLQARFPRSFSMFESVLEETDPLDIVYPGNSNEYSDVVYEVLVLLAPENADLSVTTRDRIAYVLAEGLARRFGEAVDQVRLDRAIDLILERMQSDGKMA